MNRGTQFVQLKLFMRPSELRDTISGTVEDHDPTEEWPDKYSPNLRRSIERKGVRTPVILQPQNRVDEFLLGNGHHRVETASQMEREGKEIYLPVLYSTNYMGESENASRFPLY